MSDKTKTVLVSDLEVGDTIRITQEVVVDSITDLNKTKPTMTKKLKLLKGKAVSGGWTGQTGEFVISEAEKVELVKRPKPDRIWKRIAQEIGLYTVGGGAVIGCALLLAQHTA